MPSTPSPLAPRPLGRTGLSVSSLGLGAGAIGSVDLAENQVERLLHGALDVGICLIDTAPSYGLSEERIGRHLAGRRDAFVLVTKGGYGAPGIPDWTGACVLANVDAALARCRTDRIDLFLLHSCPLDILRRDDVLGALDRARDAGKIRAAGYSGDGEALAWAVRSGRFGAVETSLNLCDQRVLDESLPAALERGVGVIAKRPIANAAWRFAERPTGDYAETYWERLRGMDLDPGGLAWDELALRFAAFQPGVASCIVGTARIGHLHRNAEIVAKGPLPDATVAQVRAAFRRSDRGWIGQT